MSSMPLLLEEENGGLEAALAFLDSYDAVSSLSDLSCTDLDSAISCEELELASGADSPVAKQLSISKGGSAGARKQSNEKPKPKRKQVAPSATSRCHKQVTADLRQQMAHLSARLSQLQKRRSAVHSPGKRALYDRHFMSSKMITESRLSAYQNAMLELQQLHEAETLNQTLKFVWKKQAKLSRRLETLLGQLASLQDMASLLENKSDKPEPTADIRINSTGRYDSNAFNIKELLSALMVLYHQAPLVCDAINVRDTSRVFSNSQVHNDHELGQTIEFTTNTPLVCTLRQLNEHMMSYLSVKKAQSNCRNVYKEELSTSTLCYEHLFTETMECQFGSIHVKGLSVARKFDEPHRHVFTHTARLAIPDTDLAFQLNVWFVMTERDSAASAPRALLQTFFRVHRDRSSNYSAVSTADSPVTRSLENATYLENFILMTRAEEMRTKLLCFQSIVLEKFGGSC